jgi:hypothetical protein
MREIGLWFFKDERSPSVDKSIALISFHEAGIDLL